MKNCSKCGLSKEETEFQFRKDTGKLSGQCKECRTASSQARHEENPEKRRDYYQKHREETLRKKSEEYWADPEVARKAGRNRYRKNPEPSKRYGRKRWSLHSERLGKENRERQRKNRYDLKRNYGLSVEDYNRKVSEQGGACAICADTGKKLFVDHNHRSGKIRDLLCRQCNSALGMLKESVSSAESLILYIKKHSKLPASV